MKATISYREYYGNDGTVYKQLIKIDDELMKKYNEYIENENKRIDEKEKNEHIIDNYYMKIRCFGNKLVKGINYSKLTMASILFSIMKKNGLNIDRFLFDRNSIIEVL